MLRQASRCWRVGATGFSFLTFGCGGLLLGCAVFPLLGLFVRARERRIVIARQIISMAFRVFIALLRGLCVLRYEITGLERLNRRGLLILANHPSLIDTVFLMAFVNGADCIVKSQLWKNPITGGPVRAAGYISNDSGVGLMADCIASLQHGNNLIIFPEGTRTDGPIKLKRGAANIAVRNLSNVTPVVIRCFPRTLVKGEKWWRVPPVTAHFSIDVKEDIDVHAFVMAAGGDGNETLAARHLTAHLQDYFKKESQSNAAA
ncbi:1-acyl-sn-glycerol-3-phosphate acyltransferase [Glaciimonas sp. PCH181]|nr:lysophospholipid acyltransferase family protein [Glaciimonas sp. PCH181]PUA19799.1 1-acyl-sn-glycerol-3-phosphate acyltransferase [Glaciimonas sp. PCH181]